MRITTKAGSGSWNSERLKLVSGLGDQLNESRLGGTMPKEGSLAEAQESMNKEQVTTADKAEGGAPVLSRVEEPAICDEREWRRF